MENENFLDDFLKGKLDYVSFMECLDGLDLQDKLDLDKKIKIHHSKNKHYHDTKVFKNVYDF